MIWASVPGLIRDPVRHLMSEHVVLVILDRVLSVTRASVLPVIKGRVHCRIGVLVSRLIRVYARSVTWEVFAPRQTQDRVPMETRVHARPETMGLASLVIRVFARMVTRVGVLPAIMDRARLSMPAPVRMKTRVCV